MPLYTNYHLGSFEDYHHSFKTRFPEIEDRFKAACQLADPEILKLPEEGHLSHNVLAAHWGDSEEDLRRIGDFLFGLKRLIDYDRQSMIVFERGKPNDVLNPNVEDLSDDVVLIAGLSGDSSFILNFGSKLKGDTPSPDGVEPPYLGFNVQTSIIGQRRISVDMLERICYIEKVEPGYSNVPVHVGRVTLKDMGNLRHYKRNRKLKERHVVVGIEACRKVLGALSGKSTGLSSAKITQLTTS